MKSTKKAARKYLEAGFNIIPTNRNKIPVGINWGRYQIIPMTPEEFENKFQEDHLIGMLTGGPGRIVCLDADMKYDLTKDLWDRFKQAVPNNILKKVMCQSTQNGGFHLVFRAPASKLVGNEKLASRYTTAEEKHITYMEAFNNPETRPTALKTAIADNSRVLFETRSGKKDMCGGYFLIYPSPGYELIYGKIGELNEEEYDVLMETARSFNEVKAIERPMEKVDFSRNWEITPYDHYNRDGDVVALLQEHGWKILPQVGKNIRFRRPGKTHASSSAMFDVTTKTFNCFSTSTCFDVGKGYAPASVFAILECESDTNLAYKKLIEMGYGIQL